jgi:beta-galactosidase
MSTRKRDIRDFPASGLRWDVDFLEGENTLIAAGYRKGKQVAADTVVVRYSYRKNQQADNIILSSERLDGGDLLITALAIDKNGQRCLDYNKRVYFSSDGSGKLCVDNGTPTGSSVIEMANGKAQIRFRPAAGTTIVECRNQDFKGSYLAVKK